MPKAGPPGGGIAGDAKGLGAGVALGQSMAQQVSRGLQGGPAPVVESAPAGMKPDEETATLEKLADLKVKGIVTAEEFEAEKAEWLKKLV